MQKKKRKIGKSSCSLNSQHVHPQLFPRDTNKQTQQYYPCSCTPSEEGMEGDCCSYQLSNVHRDSLDKCLLSISNQFIAVSVSNFTIHVLLSERSSQSDRFVLYEVFCLPSALISFDICPLPNTNAAHRLVAHLKTGSIVSFKVQHNLPPYFERLR